MYPTAFQLDEPCARGRLPATHGGAHHTGLNIRNGAMLTSKKMYLRIGDKGSTVWPVNILFPHPLKNIPQQSGHLPFPKKVVAYNIVGLKTIKT